MEFINTICSLQRNQFLVVQAITSNVRILLFGSDQTNIALVSSLLSKIKSQQLEVSTVQSLDGVLSAMEQLEAVSQEKIDEVNANPVLQGANQNAFVRQGTVHPALIFCIFEPQQEQELLRIAELNTQNIPLVLVATAIDLNLAALPVEIDDCLIWSELSAASLSKTIFLALKRHRTRLEAELISHENIELSSQLLTTKNLFQTIIDNTSTLVWMCDAQGKSTFFNHAWSKLLGQKVTTVINDSWMLKIHPLDLAECQQEFEHALAKNMGFTISYRLQVRHNEYLWISNTAVPQFTVGGEFEGLVGYCFDITSIKQTEYQLIRRAASDRLLAQITQNIHASLDLEQILQTTVAEVNQFLQAEKIQIIKVETNKLLTVLFESRLNEAYPSCELGKSPVFCVTLFQNNFSQLAAGQMITQEQVYSAVVGDKTYSIILIPIISEQKLWGLLGVEKSSVTKEWTNTEVKLLERVTMELSVAIKQAQLYQQLEEANSELAKLSVIDGLTKIANRRKFDQYITSEWFRLAREQNPLSIILCDIDYFKLYNDTYGHQAGDRCLQLVAQAIKQVVKRPADLVARYGGEEFVLVLPNTSVEGAKYLAQQVRHRVEALKLPHINSPIDLYVTLSLGVSCCIPQPNSDVATLITAADRGLYQAKATGRNRVVEYETKPE